jgi:hypothetical protein
MKFHYSILFISSLLIISNIAFTKNNILIDRLLLSINKTYYTQRQMEAYLLIKTILFPKKSTTLIVTKKNWTHSLNTFINDLKKIETFKTTTQSTEIRKQSTHDYYTTSYYNRIMLSSKAKRKAQHLVITSKLINELLPLIIVSQKWGQLLTSEDQTFSTDKINVIIVYAKKYKSINPKFAEQPQP